MLLFYGGKWKENDQQVWKTKRKRHGMGWKELGEINLQFYVMVGCYSCNDIFYIRGS